MKNLQFVRIVFLVGVLLSYTTHASVSLHESITPNTLASQPRMLSPQDYITLVHLVDVRNKAHAQASMNLGCGVVMGLGFLITTHEYYINKNKKFSESMVISGLLTAILTLLTFSKYKEYKNADDAIRKLSGAQTLS